MGSLPPAGSSFDRGASDMLTTGNEEALKAYWSSIEAKQAMLVDNDDKIQHICESRASIHIPLRECLVPGW